MIGLLALLAGDVVGVVTTDPLPAPRRELRMAIDPDLLRRIGGRKPLHEHLVINPEGRVQWAVVRVVNPPPRPPEPPPVPVEVAVEGLSYRPHVAVARTGQAVVFRNLDPVSHCLSAHPVGDRAMNVGVPPGSSFDRTFAKPEIFRVKDDVYPWMEMWLVVEDHPYVAVTDEQGGFRIRGLPPGKYTLEIWHERLEGARAEVEAGEGDVTVPDLVLKRKKP